MRSTKKGIDTLNPHQIACTPYFLETKYLFHHFSGQGEHSNDDPLRRLPIPMSVDQAEETKETEEIDKGTKHVPVLSYTVSTAK